MKEQKLDLINKIKILIVIMCIVLVGNYIGYKHSAIEALPGTLIVLAICVLSIIINHYFPFNLSAFAWATMIGFVLSLPWLPTQHLFLEYINKLNFLALTTPILAFAGISVGDKIPQLKKLSWKIVIISLVVFTSTYFGSALIANIVLKMQGLI